MSICINGCIIIIITVVVKKHVRKGVFESPFERAYCWGIFDNVWKSRMNAASPVWTEHEVQGDQNTELWGSYGFSRALM